MQQTQTYKLNKPGTDDPIAIAPLNENMEKIEAALTEEAQARAEADATEAQARQAAVDSEAQTRAAAVASEAQARANADAAEIQARQAAVSSEAQARAAADNSEAQARAAAVTALNNRAGAIEGRVTALEAHKILVGSYQGNGRNRTSADRTVVSQTIQLGINPIAVIVCREGTGLIHFAIAESPLRGTGDFDVMTLIPGGFRLEDGYGSITTNGPYKYFYIALA